MSTNKKGEDDLMIDMPNVDEAIKDKVNEDQQAVQSDKSLHGPF